MNGERRGETETEANQGNGSSLERQENLKLDLQNKRRESRWGKKYRQ